MKKESKTKKNVQFLEDLHKNRLHEFDSRYNYVESLLNSPFHLMI